MEETKSSLEQRCKTILLKLNIKIGGTKQNKTKKDLTLSPIKQEFYSKITNQFN